MSQMRWLGIIAALCLGGPIALGWVYLAMRGWLK